MDAYCWRFAGDEVGLAHLSAAEQPVGEHRHVFVYRTVANGEHPDPQQEPDFKPSALKGDHDGSDYDQGDDDVLVSQASAADVMAYQHRHNQDNRHRSGSENYGFLAESS